MTSDRVSDERLAAALIADISNLVRAAWNLCDGTANENPPEVDQKDWDLLSAALDRLDRLAPPPGVIAGPGAKVEYALQHLRSPVTVSDDAVDAMRRAYEILCSGKPPHHARESNARRVLRQFLTAALVPAEREPSGISGELPTPGGDNRGVAWRDIRKLAGDLDECITENATLEAIEGTIELLSALFSQELYEVGESHKRKSELRAEIATLTTRAETAEASLAAAREALKPFADAVHMIRGDAGDAYAPDWSPFITVGAYRAARAALTSEPAHD